MWWGVCGFQPTTPHHTQQHTHRQGTTNQHCFRCSDRTGFRGWCGPLWHTERTGRPTRTSNYSPPGRTGNETIRRSLCSLCCSLGFPRCVSLLRGLSPLPLQREPPTTHHTPHTPHTTQQTVVRWWVVGGGEVAWLARKEPSQSGTNTLRKTGRTAVTQPPVVAKKRAWVVRTHSQFEDRLRSWAPQGWPLMRCFTGCNQSSTIFASLDPSYPEGNFEGNQLLGGSIGLSPLCRTQATQFARQNSDRLPPQFPMASS